MLSVVEGYEADRAIVSNSDNNYRENLNKELDLIKNQELWEVARQLRKLRV